MAVQVDLEIDSAWTDVTGDAYVEGETQVTGSRGRDSETGETDISECEVTLDNRDGKFSPRLPTSPYYGKIGRNTPIRVSNKTGTTYLWTEKKTSSVPAHGAATTPDALALDITGDVDIRIDAKILAWSENKYTLASKYVSTGDQRSWVVDVQSDGALQLSWSPDGTSSALRTVNSTIGWDWWSAETHVRVTLDVDNGAGGHVVTFYTSTDGATWTQLGDAVTGSGTTSIFASTADLHIGGRASISTHEGFRGEIRSFELRNGIDGTAVANPDFTDQSDGATSFADDAGLTWTVNAGEDAEVTNRRVRFVGEVPNWETKWTPVGNDVWVPIKAAGIGRRLEQGAAALKSALFRELTSPSRPTPVAYWPCEDGENATSVAATVGTPMQVVGSPTFASYDGFACSDPLPVMGDSKFFAYVGGYSTTGTTIMRLLVHVPTDELPASGQEIFSMRTTGTANLWVVKYSGGGGDLTIQVRDADNASILNTGALDFNINGENCELKLKLVENGSNVDWSLGVRKIQNDGSSTSSEQTGTITNRTIGRAYRVAAAYTRGLTGVALGHIVLSTTEDSFTDIEQALVAHAGETAGRRIKRLCDEANIAFTGVGDMDDTEAMGPQRPETLLDLLREAADVDGGIVYETRHELGLSYRSRNSMVNQPPAVELDYNAEHLSPPFEPSEDDQNTRNDVTVERDGGSSARVVLDVGSMSIQAPPNGVGLYEESLSLSLQSDDQCLDQAGWRVHLGTWDEARYPTATVDLENNASIKIAGAALDIGDRITIANPPAWLPGDTIDLLVQGYSEEFDGIANWEVNYNCSPAGPWKVAVLEDTVLGRLDTDGSELHAALGGAGTGTPTVASLTNGGSSVDGTSFATASISPESNALLAVWVAHTASGATTASVAGLDLTWTFRQRQTVSASTRIELWTAQCGPDPGSGALTITTAATCTSVVWNVHEVTGHKVGAGVRTVNIVTNTGSGTATSVTFNPPSVANNRFVVGFGASANVAQTPRVNWTELGDTAATVPSVAIATQWRSTTPALVSNSGFETDLSGWNILNGHAMARSTAQAKAGSASMLLTSQNTSNLLVGTNTGTAGFAVTAGLSYTAAAQTRAATTARGAGLRLAWYDAAGAFISVDVGSFVTNSTTVWSERTLTKTAPAGAAFAALQVQILSTVSSEQHYVDEATVTDNASSTLSGSSNWAGIGMEIEAGGETSMSVRRTGDTVEDFEDATLNITVDLEGDAFWARSNAQAHGGTWSFKSGTITHDQRSDVIVTVPTDARTLTLWYLISSESGFDFGEIYLDGVRQLQVSGLGSWTEVTYDVSTISEVKFRYVKDSSTSSNDDAFYIDDLTFARDAETPLWTTDAAEFPFDVKVGGELMTVTNITGATSPQTFTVTRHVNQVVKAHSEGDDVRLARGMILGF